MAISTYVNTIAAGYGKSDVITQLESAFTWLGWHESTEVTGIVTGIQAYMYQQDPADQATNGYTHYYGAEPDATSGVGTDFMLYVRRYYGNPNQVMVANPGSGYTSGEFISFPVGVAASTLGFGVTVYTSPPTVSFGGTTNKFYDSHRNPLSTYNHGTLKLSVAPGKKYGNMFHVFRNNNTTQLLVSSGPYWNGWGHFDPVSGEEYQVGGTGIGSFGASNAGYLPCFGGEFGADASQAPSYTRYECAHDSYFNGTTIDISGGNSYALDLRVFKSGIDPKFAVLVWNQPTQSSTSLDSNTYDAIILHNFNPDFLDYDKVYCDGFTKLEWYSGSTYPTLNFMNYSGGDTTYDRKRGVMRGYDTRGISPVGNTDVFSAGQIHNYVNADDVRVYHRSGEEEQSSNPAGKQPVVEPYYTTVKGIPLCYNFVPAPYYIPDDFVLISFTYEAPNTNIQTGDIITISPTEKYYVITGAYGQSGSTAGVLFCARFV